MVKRQPQPRRFPREGGSGTYVVRLRAPEGPATYTLTTRVRPPERPRGTRKITAPEPHVLRPALDVLEGVAGMRVRIDGWNFSIGAPPVVLFGATRGLDVIVDKSGGFLDVDVPAGPPGALLPVFVINPDGQGSVADDVFFYVPEPELTGITDLFGAPVVGGSTAGGDRVLLQGRHFRVAQIVTFGGPPEVFPLLRGGEMEVRVPARPAGKIRVRITDRFGHDVESPFEYEYKSPPLLASEPFDPPVSPSDGSRAVLVRGAGFELTDVFLLDGAPVPHLFLSASLLRVSPGAGADRDATVQI